MTDTIMLIGIFKSFLINQIRSFVIISINKVQQFKYNFDKIIIKYQHDLYI